MDQTSSTEDVHASPSNFTEIARTNAIKIHRWVVFLSTFFVMIVDVGFIFSLGVLFVDFMTVFNESRAEAALVQSVTVAVSMGSGFLVGPIIQKIGTMKTGLLGSVLASFGLVISFFANSIPYLLVSIGVVTAFGTICLFIVSDVVVANYFTEKKALLLSVVNAGAGLGRMIYPFILAYMSETFGLRGTLLLSGGIVMNTIPAALLWTQPHCKRYNYSHSSEYRTEHPTVLSVSMDIDDIQKDLRPAQRVGETATVKTVVATESNIGTIASIKNLLSNKCFILFVLGLTFSYPPFTVLITFVVEAFTDCGLTESDANFGLLLMSAFSIGGRLLPGVFIQSKYITALMVPAFASFITCFSFAGLILFNSLSLKLVFCCLAGVPLGMFVSCFSVTPLDLVGPSQLGNAAGIAFTANGLANIAAGPICGFIRDVTGSYVVVFLTASGIEVVAIAVFLIAIFFQRKGKQYDNRTISIFYLTKM